MNRITIADSYLKGEGIEIGALHSPLRPLARAKVRYVDRMCVQNLRLQYPELNLLDLVDVDIIDDGEKLESIQDSSQDFVIANHFIEHCQNPILSILNMLRVLRTGGILYLAIPDKRFTFDIDRPVTSIDHLLKYHLEGPEWSKSQHFEEWVALVEKIKDADEASKRMNKLIDMDYSIHFHVWTQIEILDFFVTLVKKLGFRFDVELFLKNSEECVLILKKLI